jgi:hypothetical protein
LASAFILGLAGFAAGVIPQACRSGVVICQTGGPLVGGVQNIVVAPLDASPAPAPSAGATEPVVAVVDKSMLAREPASLTRNDLIAQTFAALDVELTTTAGELTARKVRTVAIGPDGMPVIESGAAPVAKALVEPVVEPEPAPIEVADVVEPEPVAAEPDAVSEEEPAASAYAPVHGGNAIIGRQGANVRSAPKTGGSDVLFALASGEEVTVMETSRGWSKVVDSRGRSGWIWGQLLRR